MKVYVAGSSRELDRARAAIAACRARGWHVTGDWPAEIARAGGRANRGLSPAERRGAAVSCLHGVRQADAFWLLVPGEDSPSAGCWVELGVALEAGPGIAIVASGDTGRSVFCAGTVEVPDDQAALEALAHVARDVALAGEAW